MKKLLSLSLTGFLFLSLLFVSLEAQTAQDVLNKMIEAMGGRKALEKIQDTVMSGTIEISQYGMTANATFYQKEPNKMRVDIEIQGMMITQSYDGKKGWFTNPQAGGSVEEMPEAAAKAFSQQAVGNDYLLNPQKHGVTYSLKPKETIDGKEYIVFEQKLSDGHTTTIYIDPVSFLTYKSKTRTLNQAGVEVDAETFVSDYKKVGDILVAHSMRILQDGVESMRLVFNQVSFNTGVADSFFTLGK